MRFFLVLLTFLISFQSVSWAMVGARHTSSMSVPEQLASEVGDVQMQENAAHMHNKSMLSASFNVPCESTMADMQGDCFINCLIACSTATECTTLASHYIKANFNGVVYATPCFSFTSYTESPEIQPPLEIRN